MYGIDFSFEALTIAGDVHPELYGKFFLEDMYNIDQFKLTRSFDGVVANAVFVHLLERNDLRMMLGRIWSRLSSNGLCFIRVLDKKGVTEEFDHNLFNETRWFVYYDEEIVKQVAMETGFTIIKIDRRQHARYYDVFWISLLVKKRSYNVDKMKRSTGPR